MQPYGQAAAPAPSVLSMQDFLQRVEYVRGEIGYLHGDVGQIEALHQRALASTGDGAQVSQQLEQLVASTQLRNTAIRDQIKALNSDRVRTTDGSRGAKDRQVDALKAAFEKELDEYRRREQDYSKRYREQIARQYRIVNPDASEEEVRQATDEDWGNEGIFQQAVSGFAICFPEDSARTY